MTQKALRAHPPPPLSACDRNDHLTFERKGLVVSDIKKQAWNELKIMALTYETLMSPKSFIFCLALAGGFSLTGRWEEYTKLKPFALQDKHRTKN